MTSAETRELLKRNLSALEQHIDAACRRAGRQRTDVTLVAVTKYVSPEVAAVLPELGILDLGESRPQELWRKAKALPKDVRWHLVGHLQRNKIVPTLPLVHLIHSVDSVRLLEALDAEARAQSRKIDVLLELNLSREPQKHGFEPSAIVPELGQFANLSIRGLMTMAAETTDAEAARPVFAELRRLRDQWRHAFPGLTELSMGMTNDFEIAIEEGATLVRIGSALFEGLISP